MLRIPLLKESLSRSFYDRPTETVAFELIGKALLHRVQGVWIGGIIVETEAYLSQGDLASHSARGKTKSNASMFAGPGTLYVYPIHAKYCMNAVTDKENKGTAVLIRAIEPVWGIEQMKSSRNQTELRRLTRGPAMLCQALGVDRNHDGLCLLKDRDFQIAKIRGAQQAKVTSTPRIGITKAVDMKLRFIQQGSRFLSR